MRWSVFIAEDLNPFGKGQIGGHDGRAPFVALGQQVEKRLDAVALKRNESEFVDDQQGLLLQAPEELAEGSLVANLHQFAHQFGGLVDNLAKTPQQ